MEKFSDKHRIESPQHVITAKTIQKSMKTHKRTTADMHHGVKFSSSLDKALRESAAEWDQGLQLFK
jgi:hypothetical protein